MSSRELTRDEIATLNYDQRPHRVWELGLSGDVLLLERYGSFCGWSEIIVRKGGIEVYRIVRRSWGSEEREEHFFGQPARVYSGDRFSFVEYVMHTAESERPPSAEECAQAGLDVETERMYMESLQRILDGKAPSNG